MPGRQVSVHQLSSRCVSEFELVIAKKIAVRKDGSQGYKLKSLILAQNERWRHGLGMQVERW